MSDVKMWRHMCTCGCAKPVTGLADLDGFARWMLPRWMLL
jgi:hypothetical protein